MLLRAWDDRRRPMALERAEESDLKLFNGPDRRATGGGRRAGIGGRGDR